MSGEGAQETAVRSVEAAQRRLAKAEDDVAAVRAARNTAVIEALDQGVTAYRLAQVTGMSQTAIAKIRDAR